MAGGGLIWLWQGGGVEPPSTGGNGGGSGFKKSWGDSPVDYGTYFIDYDAIARTHYAQMAVAVGLVF